MELFLCRDVRDEEDAGARSRYILELQVRSPWFFKVEHEILRAILLILRFEIWSMLADSAVQDFTTKQRAGSCDIH